MKSSKRQFVMIGLAILQFGLFTPAWCLTAINPPLYGVGKPDLSVRPEAVVQGNVGDCYFLSALASLAKLNPDAIVRMIKTNPDGTYTVTFPGATDEPITVTAPTADERSKYARDNGLGMWPAVMEKAYGEYCRRSWFRRTVLNPIPSDVPQENIDGSYFHAGIRMLTGGDVSTDWTTFTTHTSMFNKLAKAFEENKLVTVDTSPIPNAEKLPTKHEYSLLAFKPNYDDPKKSVVTIRNPWGTGEPVDTQGNARDGVNDGVFDMTIEEMSNVFHSIAIGDTPVPVIAKEQPATPVASVPPPSIPVADTDKHVEILPDGTTVTTQKYRPTISKHPDGTVVKTHGDGTVVTEKPDGSMHMVMANGREYWEMPDGTRKWHYPDGSKLTQFPDRTEITEFSSGGKLTELPDGTKIHEFTTGSGNKYKETTKPDGTKIVEKDGAVIETSMSRPTPTAEAVVFNPIDAETNSGNLTCTMFGDGENPSRSVLLLANSTPATKHVQLPVYECFVPSNPQYQVMMNMQEKEMNVPANGQLAVVIPTICASTKTQRPPSLGGQVYQAEKPQGTYNVIKCIAQASETLAKDGAYSSTPVPSETQQMTFCQLAVWMENGKKPEDQIKPQILSKDLCRKAGIDLSALRPRQKREFDDNINKIFLAVDYTRKEGHKLAEGEAQQ
jgi:hypothetical protein